MTSTCSLAGKELEFPLQCFFKVIAHDIPDMPSRIQTALAGVGVDVQIEPGHQSSHKKYITYNFGLEVDSRETLSAVDSSLRSVEGVCMVL